MKRLSRLGLAVLIAGACAACSRSSVPDPRSAVEEYAQAAAKGDADAIYELLSSDAQRNYGRAGTRQLVKQARAELAENGKALASPASDIETSARVRFIDGEEAELTIEDGELKIGAAGALPSGAHTPAQALSELRQALARRSYPGLMRVLTKDSKSAVENDLRSLVSGLEDADTLEIKVTGDSAEVKVPGGHVVRLKREAGVWKIEDFD